MACLHNPRTHEQRGVGSCSFVVQETGCTPARLVGTNPGGRRHLPHEKEDAVDVCVEAPFIG